MSEKRIGIIGAMDEEVSKIKDCLEDMQVTSVAAMDFYEGRLNGMNVVIVRSGIGKVNAAVCAQILVDRFDVAAIINTGIAGSLKNEINIGDIVLSTDAIQHDMDAVAFGYELGVIPRMDTSDFQASPDLIAIAENSCKQVLKNVGVFCGRILSGDQFISDKKKKDWLTENFAGYCTEMEGAAIAQTAYLNRIPFLIIRAISDKADDSAHMDYPAFEAMAIENSVLLMKEILKEMNESSMI